MSVPPSCYRTAVARKRPWSFCQKCRWQVTPKHAYTLDPTKSEWADYAAVQAWCGNLSGNELTRNSSGNTQPQSSELAEPLWTDPCLKSGTSVHDLISTSKKKKKNRRRWMNCKTFSPNPRTRGKSHHHQWTPLSHCGGMDRCNKKLKMSCQCTTANTTAIWQHAARTTD